ncbi:helix-turn-helix domain-containing protein [Kitasatospora purpeofusca]|uniref:helix-turn-helix domain-containing protein n=1 Tax=Kitasatospora purpeofusca TaxID=67352 RepID=UPI00224F5212|nr:helix-turn-helix transcriptional regulator [Kitasatospora purpeofusca]MCX4752927.1 helix-turn-helix domain-containing protein [Kitasatospora purpeofusca]WSR32470.1 helix-turn-helix domain-containing protein [Kitasatospora purpeofusca]WSR40558.1 helix-turn-helix domain-containing protein [Kitasatospora purpeofusca]
MSTMDRDWVRLGRMLAAARKAAGLTQGEMASELDLARATVQKIERGHEYGKVTPTHRALAQRVGWTADSVEAVLAGSEPDRAVGAHSPPPTTPELDSVLDELSERVRLALLGGQVVDGDVIDLAPDDPDSVAVLILKRGATRPPASPERMREDLRKWSQLQRAARQIFSDDESGS